MPASPARQGSGRVLLAVALGAAWLLPPAGAEGARAEAADDGPVKVLYRVPVPSRRTCGAESLCFALKVAGHGHIRLAEIEGSLPVGYHGVSAAAVAELCRSRNVPVQAVHTTLSGLNAYPAPAILHVNDSHFVVVVRSVGGRVLLFDNTVGLLDCPRGWFQRRYSWRCEALVLCEAPPVFLSLFQDRRGLLLSAGLFLAACGCYLLPARRPRASAASAGAAQRLAAAQGAASP